MFTSQTCRWCVCFAVVTLGCGSGGASLGGPDAGETSACADRPCVPGPNVLPDGGSTPDGGAASRVEQLRTALQWFGSHVRSCKKTAPKGAERDYDRVTLTFEDLNPPPNFRLVFALRSGAVDDLYTFDLKFSAYTELTIEATEDRTEYWYSDGFGYSYRVSLTVQNGYMSVRATDLTLGVELACTTVP